MITAAYPDVPLYTPRADNEYAHLATVRAYGLAYRAGEIGKEAGAHFDLSEATTPADVVILNTYHQEFIDSVAESFIRDAARAGYTHGYYGYEAMTDGQVAMKFD